VKDVFGIEAPAPGYVVLCYRNGNRNEEPLVLRHAERGGWGFTPSLRLATTMSFEEAVRVAEANGLKSTGQPVVGPLTVHHLKFEPFEVPESVRSAFPRERTVLGPEVWPSVVGALASLAEG